MVHFSTPMEQSERRFLAIGVIHSEWAKANISVKCGEC